MTKTKAERRREDRQLAASVARELAALAQMTTAELVTRWKDLTGSDSRSHNGAHLRKRLAWRIQELALGGLSEAALARIDELAPPSAKLTIPCSATAKAKGGTKPIVGRPARDPRLPEPGATIRRAYAGTEHEVLILPNGFEYLGREYGSLSKIAREITGTAWNGFSFFGIADKRSSGGKQEAA